MDIGQFYREEISRHREVLDDTAGALERAFVALVEACADSLRAGGKLCFFGNGGSAADAQHLATELTVRYAADRPALAALALTTDTSALTAIGNDLGFEQLFARQIAALGRPRDVALALSTSGKSPNVILGLQQAKELGMTAAAFSGRGGGDLIGLADPLLVVPSDAAARIQEMHILLGHALCGALERALGLAP